MNTNFFTYFLSLRVTKIVAVAGVLCSSCAFSQTIFSDNFQGYTDEASLLATWSRVTGTSTTMFLAPDPLDPANQTIQQTTAAGRLRHVIPGIIPTDASPLSFSFDFFDSNGGTANGRIYGEFRNSAGASGLLAAGVYNSVNIGTLDITRYQARSVDGGGWIQLSTPRSVGWHNFRFEIFGTSVNLFVDNVLEPDFTGRANSANIAYDWAHLGSGLTGNTLGYFDNVNVSIIPEPSALALGLLGSGAFLVRKLRRRL